MGKVLSKSKNENFVLDEKKAIEALWVSQYFSYSRFSLLKALEYIDCERASLDEIHKTLVPVNKNMPHFFNHYVKGKPKYTDLGDRKF